MICLYTEKIKYKKNVFVMFLNSSFSIHGITKMKKKQITHETLQTLFLKLIVKISYFN